MELIWILVLFFGFVYPSQPSHLEVAYQWKYLDWVWPNILLTGKNYTLGNAFTQDVDIDRQGRVFVTSPQWLNGIPISLSLVTKAQGPGGHLLIPYPNWSWHISLSCDSIVSVYRMAVIDNRLNPNCWQKNFEYATFIYIISSIQNFSAINLVSNFITIRVGLIAWYVIFRSTSAIVYG